MDEIVKRKKERLLEGRQLSKVEKRVNFYMAINHFYAMMINYRVSMFFLLNCFTNVKNLYLIPFAMLFDYLLTKLIHAINNANGAEIFRKTVEEINNLGTVSHPFLDEVLAKVNEDGYFKFSKKFGERKIVVVKTDEKYLESIKSFSYFEGTSYILLPSQFDLNKPTQKVILTHEVVHSIGDDQLDSIARLVKTGVVSWMILTLLLFKFNVFSIFGIGVLLILLFSQHWVEIVAEIRANFKTIRLLENINNPIDYKDTIKVLVWQLQMKIQYLEMQKQDQIQDQAWEQEQIQDQGQEPNKKQRQKRKKAIDGIKINIYKLQISYLEKIQEEPNTELLVLPFNQFIMVFWFLTILLTISNVVSMSRFADFQMLTIILTLVLDIGVCVLIGLIRRKGRDHLWKIQDMIGI